MTTPARLTNVLIALLAVATLTLQTAIDLSKGDPLGETLWVQARFFTNLTVFLIAVVFGIVAISGRWISTSLLAASTVWIVLVGIVYHALLAVDHNPTGWDVLVNINQHTALPILVFLAWTLFAPKAGLSFYHPVYWLVWPLGYAVYSLVRGSLDGTYAYFFLDPVKTGVPGVAAYIVGLGLLFYAAGAVLVFSAKRITATRR